MKTAKVNKPRGKRRLTQCKPTARSRITNGAQLFFVAVDGRSRMARRWRDLFREYMTRTECRHEQMCRSLASLIVRREQLDASIANGGDADIGELVRLTGAINRTMRVLGIDETPSEDGTAEAIEALTKSRTRHEARP
jgi:hypothetical protein